MTRAPYASDPATSRGRLVPEPPSQWRTEFQRDRDRIIHASAFRRLKHKTQVFVSPEGDHYRTRLTHSLEVAQIARSISRVLQLDEDLTEALALAHDLGHTAFGHAGEDALNAKMKPFGGFDHNAQGLRIVTELEQRHIGFDGLNLTWEMLEGLVKHNGPLVTPENTADDLPWAIREYAGKQDLALGSFASLEAQVAAIADDIAYNAHDLDDGLRAGLFLLEDALTVPLIAKLFGAVTLRAADAPAPRQIAELVRDLIGRMIADVLAETKSRLAAEMPNSVGDVRSSGHAFVSFSAGFRDHERGIKAFLKRCMYHHHRLAHRSSLAESVISGLFDAYMQNPNLLPSNWHHHIADGPDEKRARHVADFIAGMTDRYALTSFQAHCAVPGQNILDDGLNI
jgi:dGTPase